MSSMRNALQRRSHRERGQLPSRRHLGLLEKHKDYSLRAADYNKKQATLKSLRRKAAERNEDEFDFGMLSRRAGPGTRLSGGKRWTGKIDGERGNEALSVDAVRLLKTQDMGYLRTARNVANKEVRQLHERVVLAGQRVSGLKDGDESAPRRPTKIVFMDGAEEREEALAGLPIDDADSADDSGEDDSLLSGEDGEGSKMDVDETVSALSQIERQLRTAQARLKALTDAENELELQQARMAKTATIGGVTKKGKVFKIRERKR